MCIRDRIYGSWRGMKLVAQLGRQAGCWMFAFVILLVMLVFAKQNEVFSRMWLGLWMILGITISCLYKGALYAILKALRKKGHNIKSGSSVISVGKKALFFSIELRTPCGQPVDFIPPSLAGRTCGKPVFIEHRFSTLIHRLPTLHRVKLESLCTTFQQQILKFLKNREKTGASVVWHW